MGRMVSSEETALDLEVSAVQSWHVTRHGKRIACIFLVCGFLLHVFYDLFHITLPFHALLSPRSSRCGKDGRLVPIARTICA